MPLQFEYLSMKMFIIIAGFSGRDVQFSYRIYLLQDFQSEMLNLVAKSMDLI